MNGIYVLKLENEKYYIGQSKNIEKRIKEHFSGNGSIWTQKYNPIDVLEKFNSNNNYDEDNYTKKYMIKYGIDNVRGGSYTSFNISDEIKKFLQKEFNTINNSCFTCGKTGHFSNECNEITDKFVCQYCLKIFETKKGTIYHENFFCKKKYNNEEYINKEKEHIINKQETEDINNNEEIITQEIKNQEFYIMIGDKYIRPILLDPYAFLPLEKDGILFMKNILNLPSYTSFPLELSNNKYIWKLNAYDHETYTISTLYNNKTLYWQNNMSFLGFNRLQLVDIEEIGHWERFFIKKQGRGITFKSYSNNLYISKELYCNKNEGEYFIFN